MVGWFWNRVSSSRRHLWIGFLVAATAISGGAQPSLSAGGSNESEQRKIVTELPDSLLALLEIAKRMRTEPALILDRHAIYETLGVRPAQTRTFRSSDGSRSMNESLQFDRPDFFVGWDASLRYLQFPESDSWSVTVELDNLSRKKVCYPTRLLERVWGEPLSYRPFDVHAFLNELLLKQAGQPATGPHDGEPYTADFLASRVDSAAVIFGIGRGSCLSSIRIGNRFNTSEFSDEKIYRE